MARVAVIIPVYNGAETIGEAIASVLAQSFRDFQLIVVDDGSTDATPAVLARYAGTIRVITQPNGGIAAARNAALRASTSEFVALLDCDDVWEPSMLAHSVAALERDPSCVLAYTNLAVTDSNGTALDTALVGATTAHAPTLDEMLTQLWPIMPSAVVMRRWALEAREALPRNSDLTAMKTRTAGCACAKLAASTISPTAWLSGVSHPSRGRSSESSQSAGAGDLRAAGPRAVGARRSDPCCDRAAGRRAVSSAISA